MIRKYLRAWAIPGVFLVGLFGYSLWGYLGDLRDWRDSPTWRSTNSLTFRQSTKSHRVIYTYAVDDKKYQGERIVFFANVNQEPRISQWLPTVQDAAVVLVYFDPDAPQRSVVLPKTPAFAPLMFPLLILICLAIVLVPTMAYVLFINSFWRSL